MKRRRLSAATDDVYSPGAQQKKRKYFSSTSLIQVDITIDHFSDKCVCFVGKFPNFKHAELTSTWESSFENSSVAKAVSARVDYVIIPDSNTDYKCNTNFKKANDMNIPIVSFSEVKHLLSQGCRNDDDKENYEAKRANAGGLKRVEKVEKIKTMTDEEHEQLEKELARECPFEVKGDDSVKFVACNMISSGGNAVIFEAYKKLDRRRTKKFIVKMDKNLADEVDALQKLNHPNIIELIAYGKIKVGKRTMDYIVVPRYEPIRYDQITDGESGLGDIQMIRQLSFTMLSTVQYCHEQKYILRDLKVDNLVIEKKQHINDGELPFNLIFIDFGAAIEYDQNTDGTYIYNDTKEVIHESCGTPGYMAVEVTEEKTEYGPKCDVYSLGIVLAEFAFGKSFSQNTTPVKDIMDCFQPCGNLSKLQRDFRVLLHGMLDEYQESRLSIEECLEHPFFTE